jgi:hypothetical protein
MEFRLINKNAKIMMFQLKNKKESNSTMITGGSLEEEYDFPLFALVDIILIYIVKNLCFAIIINKY